MKKYKLIKEYPNCPKSNEMIQEPLYITSNGLMIAGIALERGDYSEFWEEVIEKDYEILSFYNKEGRSYYNVKNNTYFSNPASSRSLTYCLLYYQIHSVKRLSDGEIFTIGDEVQYYVLNEWFKSSISKITKFTIGKEYQNSKIEIFTDQDNFPWAHLSATIRKTLIPLFTTEDGVDIFEGDTFYYVKFKENRFSAGRVFEIVTAKIPGCVYEPKYEKYFSTIEKAKEYILMNKKSLSPNDILKVWSKLSGHSVESLLKNSKLMHRIITSIK